MICLLGKTCSGKDAVVKELNKRGYKKVVTYTTRPKRKSERDGITYHFITENDFKQKTENGFFAEYKRYETVDGAWYYGSALSDYENDSDDKVIILTPAGYRDIKDKLSNKPYVFYIFANNMIIKQRLMHRGDKKEEAQRRLEHDNVDFRGVENEVDKIVYNNGDKTISEVVDKLLSYVR